MGDEKLNYIKKRKILYSFYDSFFNSFFEQPKNNLNNNSTNSLKLNYKIDGARVELINVILDDLEVYFDNLEFSELNTFYLENYYTYQLSDKFKIINNLYILDRNQLLSNNNDLNIKINTIGYININNNINFYLGYSINNLETELKGNNVIIGINYKIVDKVYLLIDYNEYNYFNTYLTFNYNKNNIIGINYKLIQNNDLKYQKIFIYNDFSYKKFNIKTCIPIFSSYSDIDLTDNNIYINTIISYDLKVTNSLYIIPSFNYYIYLKSNDIKKNFEKIGITKNYSIDIALKLKY